MSRLKPRIFRAPGTMTHDEAFLQAILESPEDDLPRLVYADWLTDQGDPRGEFVHVQCLLARLPGEDPRRPHLEARQRQLLDRHQDEWLGALRPLLCRWTFRRGFLDEAAVHAATYLAHSAIAWPSTVRRVEVELSGFEVPAEIIDLVPESLVHENLMLPLGLRGRMLVLAIGDPKDWPMLEKLEFILNRDIEAVAAPRQQLSEAIRRHYGFPDPGGPEPELAGCFVSPPPFPLEEVDLGSWDRDSQAARLLARIMATAIGRDAREIRIEPGSDRFRVLYVGDGEVAEGEIAPPQLFLPVLTRIRIMAGIWIGDQRAEQWGSLRLAVPGRRVDVGVSIRRTDAGTAVRLTLRS
jgi:uncharacterized protein (TIGR02996 family)